MASSAPTLREQRELLVARSALQRIEIARDLGLLREAMRGPRTALAVGGLALGIAGLGRFGRAIRAAALGLAVFKLVRAFLRRS